MKLKEKVQPSVERFVNTVERVVESSNRVISAPSSEVSRRHHVAHPGQNRRGPAKCVASVATFNEEPVFRYDNCYVNFVGASTIDLTTSDGVKVTVPTCATMIIWG